MINFCRQKSLIMILKEMVCAKIDYHGNVMWRKTLGLISNVMGQNILESSQRLCCVDNLAVTLDSSLLLACSDP